MCPFTHANYLVLGAAIATSFIFGFLWYGPVFGKEWAKLSGLSMGSMKMKPKTMVFMVIGTFLMALTLDHALIFGSAYLKVSGASAGLQAGFWNWLGFIAPVTMGVVLWEGKPWKLWMINAGFYLVNLLVMGVILAMWM